MSPSSPSRQARDPRGAAVVLVTAVLAGGPVALAFVSGGFFDGPRLTALLATAGVLVLLALAAPARAILPASTAGRVALGALWVLAGWVALSRGRSPLPDVAGDDAERAVLYAGVLLAGVVAWRSRAAARWAEPLVAGGALVVLLYALAGRWLPGLVELTATRSAGGRLEQPLTYWNATGVLAALGAVLCVRLAGDRGRPPPLSATAAAAAVPLLCGVYLSFSRGAAAALVAGVLVLVLCAPERSQLRALGVIAGTGVVAVVVSGLLDGVRALEGTMGDREREGLLALGTTVAAMGVAAALLVRLHRGESAGRLRTGALRLPRLARPLAVVAIVLAVVGPVLASQDEDTGRRAEVGFGASTQRFASVQSNRYDYWGVALSTFADHPLQGVGAGGWGVAWLRERPIPEAARDAHSLELETLAELGLVGFALLLLVLGGVARCGALVQRTDAQLAAGPCAAMAVWAAHSALDWDWEMPAVTLPALTLAGVLVARAAAGATDAARPARAATLGARGVLLAAAVACAGVGLAARQDDRRCVTAQERARALSTAPGQARPADVARELVDTCPGSREALTGMGFVLAVDRPAAVDAIRAMTRARPEDFATWVALGAIERDPARAAAARERARALNPRGVRRQR